MIRAVIASTIVLGLAGLAATLAHRASASVRHAIWFVGLVTALGVLHWRPPAHSSRSSPRL